MSASCGKSATGSPSRSPLQRQEYDAKIEKLQLRIKELRSQAPELGPQRDRSAANRPVSRPRNGLDAEALLRRPAGARTGAADILLALGPRLVRDVSAGADPGARGICRWVAGTAAGAEAAAGAAAGADVR